MVFLSNNIIVAQNIMETEKQNRLIVLSECDIWGEKKKASMKTTRITLIIFYRVMKMFQLDEITVRHFCIRTKKILQVNDGNRLPQLCVYHLKYSLKVFAKVANVKILYSLS